MGGPVQFQREIVHGSRRQHSHGRRVKDPASTRHEVYMRTTGYRHGYVRYQNHEYIPCEEG